MTESTPIACSLSEPELRARRDELRRAFTGAIASVDELPDGYRLVFTPSDGVLATVARFVELERVCCPFLTFTLTAAAEQGEVSLAITGPAGAKEFLRDIAARVERPPTAAAPAGNVATPSQTGSCGCR